LGRKEASVGFGWGNLGERDHLTDLGVDGRKIPQLILRRCDRVIALV
jgi:hypothetical protein